MPSSLFYLLYVQPIVVVAAACASAAVTLLLPICLKINLRHDFLFHSLPFIWLLLLFYGIHIQAIATKHRQETLDARHLFIIIDTLQFIFNYTCIAIITIHFDIFHRVHGIWKRLSDLQMNALSSFALCCRCGRCSCCYC